MTMIRSLIVAGGVLTTVAAGHASHVTVPVTRPRALGEWTVQPASSQVGQSSHGGRRSRLPPKGTRPAGDQARPQAADHLVYIITGGFQFGAVDRRTGEFLPIGPGLPPDVGTGLVQGPDRSLLTLAFSGNLEAIDPATGVTSVVGPTGLDDCASPESACGPMSANVFGRLGTRFYATDFANNLYGVDPATGAATLIGPTGIPPLTAIPFSANPDGSLNVYAEALFSSRGKLYATFATATLDPTTGMGTTVIPGALYHINPATGEARLIASTDSHLTSIVNVNEAIFGFDAATGQVVALDVTNGQTRPVSDVDPSVGVIAGATPVLPLQMSDH
jgi:hypothetical protein